jgi:hypothetical protein
MIKAVPLSLKTFLFQSRTSSRHLLVFALFQEEAYRQHGVRISRIETAQVAD